MPLRIPNLSDRKYQDLLDEALARIPVHNPEWTNFNDSDPGVTLVQLFAFLTENLLYRSNQIPERNRQKFLTLLGIPLQPATSARGLATFVNERGPLSTITLPSNLEVRAGPVPFRTEAGLDVLPIEWRVVYKRPVAASDELIDLYTQLYISYSKPAATPKFALYETVPLTPSGAGSSGVKFSGTSDGSIWIALLKRAIDRDRSLDDVRAELGGKTISLGVVPALTEFQPVLAPGGSARRQNDTLALLRFEIPTGGSLEDDRQPHYRALEARATGDVLTEPGVVQLTLPAKDKLVLWDNIEPLEPGVGDLPPSFEDTNLSDRLITWVRVRLASQSAPAGQGDLRLLWAGVNTTFVSQRAHVTAEVLPQGTGAPDQVVTLSRTPVIPGSVQLTVTSNITTEAWAEIDDLLSAGAEVWVTNPRWPPGVAPPKKAPSKVFALNAESGEIRFGDGMRGARPPFNTILRADYDYSMGRAGNIGVGAINGGPALPAGFSVTNEVATWGGADAETAREGEKQIARYLQHHDRLVTAEDFKTIALRTPGAAIGRVEVLPTFQPDLPPNAPGDAPGAVTLMVIPSFDPLQPDAPMPDRLFLNAICAYLDPRRLVTTEVFLRGPQYNKIWVSIGIRVEPGASVATVREAVKQAVLSFLSPLPPAGDSDDDAAPPSPLDSTARQGWPLRTPVIALQLQAVANRVPGVLLVQPVLLAQDQDPSVPLTTNDQIDMVGLQLPQVLGISVALDTPLALDTLRSQTLGTGGTRGGTRGDTDGDTDGDTRGQVPLPLPVPVIPEECQ